MARFVVRRLIHGLIVIFGVTVVVFAVTRMIGDPVRAMLPPESPQSERDLLAHQLGFDRSIPEQFVTFIGDLATLDFGDSISQHRPAMDVVAERLPSTLRLIGASMVVVVVLSLALGVLAALKPGSVVDKITVTTSLLGLSVAQFWLGLLLIVVFAVHLGWLPTSGSGGDLNHLVLPALTLALPSTGRLAVMVRSTMIDELNRPWIKTAKAKGMTRRRTVGVHALRNAAIPVLTLLGWELIRMLAGYTVIVETVFSWPGIGFAAKNAIDRHDLILLQAIVFAVALLVVLVNVAIDILYKFIDPRIKLN